MIPEQYFDKSRFVARLLAKYPELNRAELNNYYDMIMREIGLCLNENPNNRVYIPDIGAVYTDIIPSNEIKGHPTKKRYRLSCRPRKL